jgi:hypothetical protein
LKTKDIINSNCRTFLLNLIQEWIHNEKDRGLLERHLLDGIPFEPLAEEFGLSTQQAKTRVYEAQSQLFKHL